MKTTENLFFRKFPFMRLLCLLLVIFVAFSCSKDESLIPVLDNTASGDMKSKMIVNGVFELNGSTHFQSYAVKEHRVISPWELNMLECKAVLTIDGHDMTLETEESMGDMLFRTVTFTGHISSDGTVKFSWPDEWWDLEGIYDLETAFFRHTGCIMFGPAFEYTGKFDGKTFYAATHFIARQLESGMIPFYSTGEGGLLEELIDGPIKFLNSIELTVAE